MGNSQEETALDLLIIEGAIRRMGMYLVSVFVTRRLTVVICSPLSVCYMPLTIVNTLPTAAFIRRIGRRVLQSVRGGDGRAARRSRLHGLITLHTSSLVCLSDLLLTTPSSVFYPILPDSISLAVSAKTGEKLRYHEGEHNLFWQWL